MLVKWCIENPQYLEYIYSTIKNNQGVILVYFQINAGKYLQSTLMY